MPDRFEQQMKADGSLLQRMAPAAVSRRQALLAGGAGALGPVAAVPRRSSGGRRPALRLRAEAGALPLRRTALCRAELPVEAVAPGHLPLALADLHRCLAVGGRLDVVLAAGPSAGGGDAGAPPRRERLEPVLTGAGFRLVGARAEDRRGVRLVCRREWTLPDTVAFGMRVLVCGLNPSLYAADAGTAFARPGNRFWPAALGAGMVSVDRDPWHALRHHRVGMTDMVKRATVAADELHASEYRRGLTRVERLCAELRPAVVCFVGLAGWRSVVDRRATVGRQSGTLGGTLVYLMPSTSGRNASSRIDDLTAHLRAALTVADATAGD